MTKFSLNKIDPKRQKSIPLYKKSKAASLSIYFSIGIIVLLCATIIKVFLSIDFQSILLTAGATLEKDAHDHTNFLLIGTGNEEHDGADLTDTLILASLDTEDKTVSMTSIPRDLHLKDDEYRSIRINEVFYYAKEDTGSVEGGLEYLIDQVEDVSGQEIHYYVKIDFQGFVEIIDVLGGVEVTLDESLIDPFYPKGETGYLENFTLSAGKHILDGETALKFVRSRKTTSDFDRSKRQQQLLEAIKEKALKKQLILDQGKIKELIQTINENFQTNLTTRELLTLGALAKDFNTSSIYNSVISDEAVQCGGLLYTPDAELYQGAQVFIPAGGYERIAEYFDVMVKFPAALKEAQEIRILNGTEKYGAAAETKQVLQRLCLEIHYRFGNARSPNLKETKIYYTPIPLPKESPDEETKYKIPETIALIQYLIPTAETSTEIPQEYIDQGYTKETSIILELGEDYTSSSQFKEDYFFSLYAIIYAEDDPDSEDPNSTETDSPTPSNETE
jgi:LCP family protein required for cell wall assembly